MDDIFVSGTNMSLRGREESWGRQKILQKERRREGGRKQ